MRSSAGHKGPQAELEKEALVSDQRRLSAPPSGLAACLGAESVGSQKAGAEKQTEKKYGVEPFGGAVRRLSRFMSGRGRSRGRVLGVRRLLPLLDLLHRRPLAHRLLLLVRPTVDTTGTVTTLPSSGATGFYWCLLASTLLAAASTVELQVQTTRVHHRLLDQDCLLPGSSAVDKTGTV